MKYLPVVPYSEQLVGHCNPVGIGSLGVPEDGIWQPKLFDHIAIQSQFFHRVVVSETAVGPGLSKDNVDLVFLGKKNKTKNRL